MSDSQTEVEILKPRVRQETSQEFKKAALEGQRIFQTLSEKGEDVSLNEILSRVYDWENEFGDKVAQNEIEALQALSLVLGTVDYYLGHMESNKRNGMLQSIKTQRDILKMVFANLNENGRPNETIVRSFGLITCVFEKFFDQKDFKLTDAKAISRNGTWQGAMGMVTTALLFNKVGWEVRLGPVELDLDYDCDLFVKNPIGQVYAVDVTAKRPHYDPDSGEKDKAFFVSQQKPGRAILEQMPELAGKFRINVPPIWLWSSDTFYENKKTGYPNAQAVAEFDRLINT